MLVVAFPDEGTLRRHLPEPPEVGYRVWDLTDPPLGETIDLLVARYMVDPAAYRALTRQSVRVVQSQTLGYDGVRSELPSGVVYCNAVGVHEDSTAELAMAMMLSDARELPEFQKAQQSSRWEHRYTRGLAGQKVVILGAGGVGSAILRRLSPFGVDVQRVGRSRRTDELGSVADMEGLPELLAEADCVVIAIPLTAETSGLVGTEFLAQLHPGALLVNVSRGPIVDTEALVRAVASRGIRAALDVTDPEPLPEGHRLWTLPGVTITPHIGGHTEAMVARIDAVISTQIERLRSGQSPINAVFTS